MNTKLPFRVPAFRPYIFAMILQLFNFKREFKIRFIALYFYLAGNFLLVFLTSNNGLELISGEKELGPN